MKVFWTALAILTALVLQTALGRVVPAAGARRSIPSCSSWSTAGCAAARPTGCWRARRRAGSRTSSSAGRCSGSRALTKIVVGFGVGLAGTRFLLGGPGPRTARAAGGDARGRPALRAAGRGLRRAGLRAEPRSGSRARATVNAGGGRGALRARRPAAAPGGPRVRIYEDLRIVQAALAVLQSMVVALPGPAARLLLAPAGGARAILPRPRREQPHPRRAHRRAPRAPARPQGPGPRGEPPVLQRRADPRAQRQTWTAPWCGSPRLLGVRRGGGPRAAGAAGRAVPPGGGEDGRERSRTWPRSRPAAWSCPRSASTWCRCAPTRWRRPRPTPSGASGRSRSGSSRRREFEGLEAGDLVGQAGVESQYNRSLMGRDGLRRVVVNSRGVEVGGGGAAGPGGRPEPHPHPRRSTCRRRWSRPSRAARAARWPSTRDRRDPGHDLDARLRSELASRPGSSRALWAELATDPETPLMNRVIQGTYAPGSIFKIVDGHWPRCEEGVITPSRPRSTARATSPSTTRSSAATRRRVTAS